MQNIYTSNLYVIGIVVCITMIWLHVIIQATAWFSIWIDELKTRWKRTRISLHSRSSVRFQSVSQSENVLILLYFFSALVRVFYLICEWKCVQWLQTAETNSENCRLYLCAPCALFFILLHKTNLQLPQLPWMITFQSNDNNAMESGTTNDMKKKS